MCMMKTCLNFELIRAQGVILCNWQGRTNNGHFACIGKTLELTIVDGDRYFADFLFSSIYLTLLVRSKFSQ